MSLETAIPTYARAESTSTSTRTGTNSKLNPTPFMDDSDSENDRMQRPRKRKFTQRQLIKRRSIRRLNSESDNDSLNLNLNLNLQNQDVNPNLHDEDDVASEHTEQDGLKKEDLNIKCYAELKKMFTNPALRTLYGDDLLTATWKANFKRMTLDLLHAVVRDQVPERFCYLLDEVIESKTYEKDIAALHAVDDEAYRNRFPHDLDADEGKLASYRVAKYKEGRQVLFPPHRFR